MSIVYAFYSILLAIMHAKLTCQQNRTETIRSLEFNPHSAPTNWHLNIEITASSPFAHNDYNISVAGQQCVRASQLESQTKVSCSAFSREETSGPIQMWDLTKRELAAHSSQNFTWTPLEFYGIYPTYAPVSGETKVWLYKPNYPLTHWKQMKIGGILCKSDSDVEGCIVSLKGHPIGKKLSVALEDLDIKQHPYRGNEKLTFEYKVGTDFQLNQDHWVKTLTLQDLGYEFEFRPDPIFSDISPKKINYYRDWRRYKNIIQIRGRHMDSVPLPMILLDLNREGGMESNCTVEGSERWDCFLPDNLMDGSHTVTLRTADTLVPHLPSLNIYLCPAPKITSFENISIKITETEPQFIVFGTNFCSDIDKLLVNQNNVTVCSSIDQISPEKFMCRVNLALFKTFKGDRSTMKKLSIFFEGDQDHLTPIGVLGLISTTKSMAVYVLGGTALASVAFGSKIILIRFWRQWKEQAAQRCAKAFLANFSD